MNTSPLRVRSYLVSGKAISWQDKPQACLNGLMKWMPDICSPDSLRILERQLPISTGKMTEQGDMLHGDSCG